MLHAKIDPDTCIGCGLCPSMCPEIYQMEGDLAKVIADPVPPGGEDCAREAAESCPVAAISISED